MHSCIETIVFIETLYIETLVIPSAVSPDFH